MRRSGSVLLWAASALFLVGCGLVGLSIAETGSTQDIWTNLWFDIGLPLLVLALAMGVHALAMMHRRTLPPLADDSGGPDQEIPGA